MLFRSFGWLLPGQMDPEVFVALLDRTGRRLAARAEAVRFQFADALPTDAAAARSGAAADLADDLLMLERIDVLDIEARRLLARHDAPGAMRRYEGMLRIAPESALAHYGLAMTARESGQAQAAFWHFAHAVQLEPAVTGYRMALGRMALDMDQAGEAIRQFRVVLSREPGNAEALDRLSCALACKGPARDLRGIGRAHV